MVSPAEIRSSNIRSVSGLTIHFLLVRAETITFDYSALTVLPDIKAISFQSKNTRFSEYSCTRDLEIASSRLLIVMSCIAIQTVACDFFDKIADFVFLL